MTSILRTRSPLDLLSRVSEHGARRGSAISVLDLFKIGIGPSSSHTIGPMKAAAAFVAGLSPAEVAVTERVRVTLFGSLAWTGKGHATDRAVMLGLSGHLPDLIDPDDIDNILNGIVSQGQISLPQGKNVPFFMERDIVFDKINTLPRHPNALQFQAVGEDAPISTETWYSIGGGFIEREGQLPASDLPAAGICVRSADELLELCRSHDCSIAELAMANECAIRDETATVEAVDRIIDAMMRCIDRGLVTSGRLPGPLGVNRRAAGLYGRLKNPNTANARAPSEPFGYISAFAIAVNEENAAGGRVVTAPTNGAAGVVPSVLRYYRDFCAANHDGMRTFLLTATAVGGLIKQNASISGAEVGCQGEVGSASAMAAAGLVAALGGSPAQIENAAEISMEHHLGMTCDPVAGLVQIPCIERNAFGAIKAVNAAYLALAGDGDHRVSLDTAIETMRQTGADMHDKYRETSRGGLAVNVPEC